MNIIKNANKIKKPYELYNTQRKKFDKVDINNNNHNDKNEKLKKNHSSKFQLNNRFYKLFKNDRTKTKRTLFPYIVDKNPFNFSTIEDRKNRILERMKEGEMKHNLFSQLAYKKGVEKIKRAKEFFKQMKKMKSNLEIIKKNEIEGKRKVKEIFSKKIVNYKIRDNYNTHRRSNQRFNGDFETLEKFSQNLNKKSEQLINEYNNILSRLKQ